MRVEMEDGQIRDVLAEGAHDGQRDRVIAAQANGTQTVVKQFSDFGFDGSEGLLEGEVQVAGIAVGAFGA